MCIGLKVRICTCVCECGHGVISWPEFVGVHVDYVCVCHCMGLYL